MKENQIGKLQAELRALRRRMDGGGGADSGGGGSPRADGAEAAAKLSLQCSLEVSRPGGCRVLEHNAWLGMLVASQPSQNALFPGHGVRKINTLDMRALQFVSLHQKQVSVSRAAGALTSVASSRANYNANQMQQLCMHEILYA